MNTECKIKINLTSDEFSSVNLAEILTIKLSDTIKGEFIIYDIDTDMSISFSKDLRGGVVKLNQYNHSATCYVIIYN